MGLGVWDFIWALDVSVRDTVLLAYRGEWLASLVCITERISNQKSIINSNVPNNTIHITMTNDKNGSDNNTEGGGDANITNNRTNASNNTNITITNPGNNAKAACLPRFRIRNPRNP